MRRSFAIVLAIVVLPVFGLTGCNTFFKDSYQKITILTPGVENAECILETTTNKYRMLASGVVEVDRSRHPMIITCQKTHYLTSVKNIESKIRMTHSQLNVFNLFTGIPYDVASNSIYEYPEMVTIEMSPDPHAVRLSPIVVDVLQQKKVAPKPAPPAAAPPKGAVEKAISKSLRK